MDDFINYVENFINKHLQSEFTLNEIASYCGYSPSHFSHKFKEITNQSVMEYVREKRIFAAAELIKNGANICSTAMLYGFETHAGFTKAFHAVLGCSPKYYMAHFYGDYWKGFYSMDNSKIIIRPIKLDDVNDLWENVYSAMTPKEILDIKITPAIEHEKSKTGIELAAEVDGRVVMTLPMAKPFWIPIGFLFDNDYLIRGDKRDDLMKMLLDEMKTKCKEMDISVLVSPQRTNSENIKAFLMLGFKEIWADNKWTYLATSVS